MKIKEVEELTGLSRANIRLYERKGLLAPSREDNNYRDYTDKDVERLRKIVLFRKMDFSIDDIRDILNKDVRLLQVAEQARMDLEEQKRKIEGSLEMCNIICENHESIRTFDTDEYEKIMHELERDGEWFHEIVEDVMEDNTSGVFPLWRLWQKLRIPKKYWVFAGLVAFLAAIFMGLAVVWLIILWRNHDAALEMLQDMREDILGLLAYTVFAAIVYFTWHISHVANVISRARFPAGKTKEKKMVKAVGYAVSVICLLLFLYRKHFLFLK